MAGYVYFSAYKLQNALNFYEQHSEKSNLLLINEEKSAKGTRLFLVVDRQKFLAMYPTIQQRCFYEVCMTFVAPVSYIL